MSSEDSSVMRNILEKWFRSSTNNFDQVITNSLETVVKVPGENDIAPERLEVFSGGDRIFLEYGDDSRYSDTEAGRELIPGSDEEVTARSTARATYPVGLDLIPSHAFQINGPIQSGDAVALGFGVPDLANFDPVNIEWSGTTADGVFIIFTEETGTRWAWQVMVQNGTVVDKHNFRYDKDKAQWARTAFLWNWYDNGPAKHIESYTDVEGDRKDPQKNVVKSSVANDDGKGPANGSHRLVQSVYQASGNTGLVLECGSMATQYVGSFPKNLKTKESTISLDVSNTTDGDYEVLGAVKHAEDRETEEMNITGLAFTNIPDSNADVEVLIIAVDPSETNFSIGDFSTPPERNETNTAYRQATSTTATGPDADAAGTDASGSVTSEVMQNPGGFQIGRRKRGSSA